MSIGSHSGKNICKIATLKALDNWTINIEKQTHLLLLHFVIKV